MIWFGFQRLPEAKQFGMAKIRKVLKLSVIICFFLVHLLSSSFVLASIYSG